MKTNLLIFNLLFFSCLFFQSCERKIPEPTPLVQGNGISSTPTGGTPTGGTTTGTIMFWSSSPGAPISVYIASNYYGKITSYYPTQPACSSSGCVTVSLYVGTYNVTATDGTTNWGGPVTCVANVCTAARIN